MSALKQLLMVTVLVFSAVLAVTNGPFTIGWNTVLSGFFLAAAIAAIAFFGSRPK